MTDRRKAQLFDGAMSWVFEHIYESGTEEYVNALHHIGFTDAEAMEETSEEQDCISAVWNVYHPEEEVDFSKLSFLIYLYKKKTHSVTDENVSWDGQDEIFYKHILDYARWIIRIAQYWNDEEVVGFIADHLPN